MTDDEAITVMGDHTVYACGGDREAAEVGMCALEMGFWSIGKIRTR